MPIVTIVIPAYNVEHYIQKGLESAIKQTESNIEIIVVDDGSTDSTGKIINKFVLKDKRIIKLCQKNKGVSAARNNALDKARGKYILFLDSDDWLEADAVEKLLKMAECEDDKLVCCECYFANIGPDGMLYRKYQGNNEGRIIINRNKALHYIGKSSRYKLQSACYKLFRKNIIEEKGLRFNQKIHYGEDGIFTFQYLCNVEGIIYESCALWNVLNRPGSATKSGYNIYLLGGIDAVDIMLSYTSVDYRVKNNLFALKAERAMLVEITGIRSGKANLADMQYVRRVLRKYMKYLLVQNTGIKLKLQCIILAVFPFGVIKLLLKKRDT